MGNELVQESLTSSNQRLRTAMGVLDQAFALIQVSTPGQVMETLFTLLDKTSYRVALFAVDRAGLVLYQGEQAEQASSSGDAQWLNYPEQITLSAGTLEKELDIHSEYKIIKLEQTGAGVSGLPEILFLVPAQNHCVEIALIPGWNAGRVEVMIILGATQLDQLSQEGLDVYAKLVDIAATVIGKLTASQRLEKRLAALQTLNTVSQAVSISTDLNLLYQVVHQEVKSIMGQINFAIATYDAQREHIAIPYMYDGQSVRSVDAFPLGEGLTSIIIRTKKSLLLVEDTDRKAKELGAKLVGKPAKSWLGVPLLVGGDVLGAIIVQDLEHESRFDLDDQRLLETLSSQVAVAIRNAMLLESTSRQATRQQLLYEITSKIRNSSTIPEIMEIMARELSQALGANYAKIWLGVDRSSHENPTSSEHSGS